MNIYEILAPSGREENMAEYISNYAENLGYKTKKDVFGNLICEIGDNPKTAIECGMDSLCLMKTAETESGMIKVSVPLSSEVKNLVGKKVRFLNGVLGVVRCSKTEDIEDFDLSVDIGETDKDGAKNAVPTGEFATIVCEKTETEKFIFGSGISSFVPLMIALEVMKTAKDTAFLFTAQKKFAGRGVRALLGGYEAETIISLNTLLEKDEIKCTKGAIVVIKEKGAVPTVSVRKALISSADGDVQLGATDEALYLDLPQLCGKGAYCGGVCVAVRDKGGAYEGVAKSDIESAVKLLCNYLEVK